MRTTYDWGVCVMSPLDIVRLKPSLIGAWARNPFPQLLIPSSFEDYIMTIERADLYI
jgi:hypothetical protein